MERKKILKRIFSYTKKYRFHFILSIALALVVVATTLIIPIYIGRTIDNMTGKGSVNFHDISVLLSNVLLIITITAVAQYFMNLSNNYIVFGTTKDLRKEATNKISRLPIRYFDKNSYGDIVSRIIADVDQFGEGLLLGFTQGFTGVMTLVGTVIFMFNVNVKMTVIVLVSTPLALFIATFISKKSYAFFKQKNVSRGVVTALMEEGIAGQNVIQAFCMQNETLTKFNVKNEELKVFDCKGTFFSSLPNPSTRFVYALIYAGLTCGGAYLAINGQITIGLMTSFLGYATQYTKPFNEMTEVTAQMQNAISCAGRIFEFLDEEEEKEDDKKEILSNLKGKVSFKNVYFSYSKDKKLIEDFNLEVSPGKKVAIVGPTGCGKSTLINLLMRFYDVDSGGIYIDDKNINEMSRKELRTHFGMVLQETWLLNGSIKENIAIGKKDASDEEIINAAKEVQADSFIRKLKNGYETIIDEMGGSLSAGQKQLLCIARIMLNKPKMLILDEATSSIDARTEIKVQEAFEKLMSNKTSFIVAHRLSTIQNADIILVMKDGKIIEMGNHKNLLENGGFYYNLYHSQYESSK